jgi:hypothetical protein
MRQRPLLRFASDVVVVAIVVLALVTTWLLSEALFFVVSTLFVLLSLVALRVAGGRSSGTAASEPLAERVQLEPAFEALAEQELVRARRYERPLTLLSVAVQNARARPEPSPELGTSRPSSRRSCGRATCSVARTTVVCWSSYPRRHVPRQRG